MLYWGYNRVQSVLDKNETELSQRVRQIRAEIGNAIAKHKAIFDNACACPYRKLYPTGAKPRITRCLRSWETFSN
jgi:hypothetical protein